MMSISDSTLRNIASLLPRETRMKLFEDLCKTFGKRVPERVSIETGIRKTDVYRYLPKSKSRRGGLVPSPATTIKVIKALLKNGQTELVTEALNPAGNEMRKSYLEYFKWIKNLRKRNVIYNPLSDQEIRKILKSLGRYGVERS